MILNTKYLNIREIINKKLEEFILALDEIKIFKNKNLQLNKLISSEDISNDDKIYISTSQILTKILLGKN